jgi:hypothetical protein
VLLPATGVQAAVTGLPANCWSPLLRPSGRQELLLLLLRPSLLLLAPLLLCRQLARHL